MKRILLAVLLIVCCASRTSLMEDFVAEFEFGWSGIIRHEGLKFTNNPKDPGGATKYGITLGFLKSEPDGDIDGDGDIDADDVKKMSVFDAEKFYRRLWRELGYGEINDDRVAARLFDTAVNMGRRRAVRILQRSLVNVGQQQVSVDGSFGPQTLAATNAVNAGALLSHFRVNQRAYYQSLVVHNPNLQWALNGWFNRADDPI